MGQKRLRLLFVLLIVLTLVLAACGGDETPTPTEEPAPAATSQEVDEEPTVEPTATTEPTDEPEATVEATDEVEDMDEDMAEATMEATDEVEDMDEDMAEATMEATEPVEDMAEATMEATDEVEDMDEDMVEATMEATEPVEDMAEATMEADMDEDMAEATMEADMDEMMGPSVMLAPGEDIKLGFAAALTGEGLAPFGVDIRRGVELALAARQTVTVDGVEFSIVMDVQDSLCSPEGGQTVANRFVSDEAIVAVVGPMCSGAAEAAIPIFDEAGYTSISASATAAVLTNMGSTSFNRVVASDAQQGVAAANFMYNVLGITKIAIIHDGSTYGEGLVDVVEATFIELGGEVVARDAVAVGDTNFVALLEDIAAEEPELIYFGGFNAEGARLIEQRVDAALEDTVFMGADGIYGPELIELAGESSNGVYSSRPIPVSSSAVDDFAALYEETYGEAQLSAFSTNAYDATNLILDGIESVGYIDDRGDLVVDREALAAYIRSYEADGLTGALVCDGTGDCSTAAIGFYQVIDGEYVLLDDAGQPVEMEAEMDDADMEAEATPEAEMTAEPEATAEADD